ncbi:translocation/assembly module TamB domain-containing protein [Arcticibacter svalbardensis]|uniref:translocation/assembly module TamB domain-containing protein n=1 Tax=Arcticibacter svalbardensis TaxID=1288027 RepID=UPI0003A73AD9|nr:translocation/assembly module TamB domain-containing protein [Arcticibacter svalbardensis]
MSAIILLAASLIFALQFKSVQTFAAKKAATYLSKELDTKIEITSLYIKPFKLIVLEGLYVQDRDKDTLLYTPKFSVDLNLLSLKNKTIDINTIQLDSGSFFLKRYPNKTTNLQFILDYFNSGKPKQKTTGKPYTITLEKVIVNNTSFKYKNLNDSTFTTGVNFNDIALSKLNAVLTGIDINNYLFKAKVRGLSFEERSGFKLNNLNANTTIDTARMEFADLHLETDRSLVSNYLVFKYKNFGDFSDFINKVYVKGSLKNSTLDSKDISYFTTALKKMNVSFKLNGNISGYVNNINAQKFSITAGQATYVKGDFKIKGLPNLDKTHLDLKIERFFTNKKDADNLIKRTTGLSGKIPLIAQKLGNVSFTGSFKGLIKDFETKGEIKTGLGRLIPDIRMNLLNLPAYSGTVKAVDFNLGELLDQKSLGRTTVTAKVDGKGFNLNQLKDKIDANATYFDLKGYRYTNININGNIINKLFQGRIKINDPNIKLDFNGDINLNTTLPSFNFNASLTGVNLHKLHFSKDTLQLDADLNTAFTGNNLNNIEGKLEMNRLRFTSSDSSLVVNSIVLSADGIGSSRSIAINSDILEAKINGQYDLNTLPSYFKSVVKRYIPSLKTDIRKFGLQEFNFYLNIKDFAPLSMLLIPDLKIPKGAVFYGRFNSNDSLAAINGSSELIQYKKIKVNNFIIDESAASKALNLFMTADRIDITDSLYIQNINVANILYKDSLALNIKLSDKDANNQLDLNALVEFGTDTLAKLSLLPSDFIINREIWKVPEQVKLRFDKRKVFVQGFELLRNDQLLTIDGIISDQPEDKLNIDFQNFTLVTFNSLTKAAGVVLGGRLNGKVALSSVLKTAKVESQLKIDTLVVNNTGVGDLKLVADLDNETKLVNVTMDITKDGKKTMNIQGTYNASAEINTLDLNVSMEDNELVIFTPAIRSLVSNVKGKVSAKVNVSGNILDPKINGTLSLKDAHLTVNYLRTPYRITDNVAIENSVINLDDLELTDINDNKAIATGTVDLTNLQNPVMDISIKATRFMALNTTAKDNPIYYGTAYATGTFKFRGPIKSMNIDINAKTEAGTVFNIPLNASETIGNNDYITFVAKDSSFTPKAQSFFQGLVMNFDLVVDENSQVNIITNLGKLNGRGNATLNLKITSLGDFEMYGDYLISSGKFQLTAQDFINKIFDLSQGGSIRWTGDPSDALINLKAVYGVRTDISPLYQAAGRAASSTGRVLAEAIMNLSGNLAQPDISFDINFPSDTYFKDEFQNYFSDVNNKNTQALSLIVRRSFSPNTGLVNVQAVNSTLFSAGTELFFNQLNNILAQSLNLNFVDLNIRSLNEASASLRLLKDRLVITGGVTDRRAELNDLNIIGNSVARDVELLYLLRKDGSLNLRASNRLNNRNFLNPDQEYISAIGLLYRQDFETLNEFLRALVGKRRRDERQLPAPIPVSKSPSTPAVIILPTSTESSEKKTSK